MKHKTKPKPKFVSRGVNLCFPEYSVTELLKSDYGRDVAWFFNRQDAHEYLEWRNSKRGKQNK